MFFTKSNFIALLKFQFKYKLGLKKLQEMLFKPISGFAKISFFASVLLLLILCLCILIPYGILLNYIYSMFSQQGNTEGYFMIVTFLANTVVFATSILSVYSIMFTEKDMEILTPLPIKKHHIFIVNFITVYLSTLVSSFTFLLPGFIVYFFNKGFSIIMLLKMLIGVFSFPILPLVLAFVLLSLILRFASRFKYKELLATIGGAFLVIVLFFISNRTNIFEIIIDQQDNAMFINKILFNSYFYSKALSFAGIHSVVYILLSLVSSFVLSLFVIAFGGKIYPVIIEKMRSAGGGKSKKDIKYVQNKQHDAFCKKEIKTILRSPVYALNCLFNIVIAPVAAYSLYSNKNGIINFCNDSFQIFLISFVMCLAIMSLNMVPSTSFSREGKYYWLIQIVPVTKKRQIKGRAKAAVILYHICACLFFILIGVLLKFDFLYIIYGLVISLFAAMSFSYAGLLIDINKPKLFWDKESEAVKQNFNGVLGMLVSLLLTLFYSIPIILYFTGVLPKVITLILIPILMIVCIFILRYVLYKPFKNQ